jgi:RND family efflux transporter MFP subunit
MNTIGQGDQIRFGHSNPIPFSTVFFLEAIRPAISLPMDCRGLFHPVCHLLSAICYLGLLGCQQKPATQAPPPPTVTVAKPVKKEIVEWQYFTAQAAVESAELNLDFTQIQSPLHGRIGAQLVNRGNLVQANSTELTTIVSIDPIYAYFYVDQPSFMRYQQAVKAGKLPSAWQAALPVWLQLETEQGYPHQGVIDFVNNAFDPSTATLQVRGRFPNQDGYLIPGAFGTVRVAGSPEFEGILVAERAIGSDQDQKYVVIVQPDGLSRFQRVELGPIVDGLRVVRSGLKGDETIVVEGIGQVRPNTKVNAEPTDMSKYATEELAMETRIGQEQVSSTAARLSSPKSVPTKLPIDQSPAQSASEVARTETKALSAMGATKAKSER